VALTRATDKFTRRFQVMEDLVDHQEPKKDLEELDFEAWDDLWRQVKKQVAAPEQVSQTGKGF
jgi:uncharacterized protein YabN with tetrapyrrole methylase and pyrophosphatase domain